MTTPAGLSDEERADDDREPFRNRREEAAWNNGYAAGHTAASVAQCAECDANMVCGYDRTHSERQRYDKAAPAVAQEEKDAP